MSGKNYMKHHILPIVFLGCAAALGLAGTANAKQITPPPPTPPTNCDPVLLENGWTENFDTSNVEFRTFDSVACAGLTGNDSVQDLNTLWAPDSGSSWYLLAKDDNVGSGGSSTGIISTDAGDAYFTLKETMDGGGAASSGTWELSWFAEGGVLPITMDFAVVLKASDAWAAFRFDQEEFKVDNSPGSGTWTIQFYNNGGNIPAISHFSLYFRNATGCEGPCGGGPGGGVPVPAPLALLGLGAGLLGWTSRRARA